MNDYATHEQLLAAITAFVTHKASPVFPKSRWFNGPALNVYIRTSRNVFNNQTYRSLVVASVSVRLPGCGTYSEFLKFLESLATETEKVLVIENVIEEAQHSIYEKRGFMPLSPNFADGIPHSFIKVLPNSRRESMVRKRIINAQIKTGV